jgi:ADP-ribose pyrophosphatase
MKLKEKFLKKQFHFSGKAVSFRIDQIRLPNGKKATREYLDHPGAVGIIPVLKNGDIVMVRQYRHPVREITWEIPAGKLDRKEPLLLCARRELQEETGYTSGKITKLLSFWPTAAFANEVIHIYVAKNLKPGKPNTDEDEFLNTEIWSLKKGLQAVKNGKIKDSKTIIALLSYKAFLK